MRTNYFLPLAVATALVIPDNEVMSQIAIESSQRPSNSLWEQVKLSIPSKDEVVHEVENTFTDLVESSKNALDDAFDWASGKVEHVCDWEKEHLDIEGWLSSASEDAVGIFDDGHPPHHGPPHGPPHHPPHKKPHHGHKSNLTVYELISKSKYTTKLAALINKDSDLVSLLNGTTANFTVFAPTDKAFAKIPDHGKHPSEEFIKKILSYHISSDFYPAGRVLVSRTIPTLLDGESLSEDPTSTPQRLATNIGLRGLTVNFYSRIVAIDILGTNGVIHGVDSILVPPPPAAKIISFLPSEFSTLELGLRKTSLYDVINDTSTHLGGTLFAPSNFAFQKLGPKINAFLFSSYGQKYLAALLKYHVVANSTLYSDAFYTASKASSESIPKGKFHVSIIPISSLTLR
jgi:uncharacterized surface protein with fasciclin (FAS1) repeats